MLNQTRNVFIVILMTVIAGLMPASEKLITRNGSSSEYVPEVYVDPVEPGDDIDETFVLEDQLKEIREKIEAFDGDGSVNFNLETGEITIEERISGSSSQDDFTSTTEGVIKETSSESDASKQMTVKRLGSYNVTNLFYNIIWNRFH